MSVYYLMLDILVQTLTPTGLPAAATAKPRLANHVAKTKSAATISAQYAAAASSAVFPANVSIIRRRLPDEKSGYQLLWLLRYGSA